jgi:hypothetical protein
LPRERGCSVCALIIDDDNFELAGIILARQTDDCAGNRFRFVASRNDGNNTRPVFARLRRDFVFPQLPKISAREKEIKPNSKRNGSEVDGRQEHTPFCNKREVRATPDLRRGWFEPDGLAGYAKSSDLTGSRRIRFPVAAKIALHIAGATTGNPGSPMPVGSSWLMTT